jgi:carboxypeptidase C (cathepsin A)
MSDAEKTAETPLPSDNIITTHHTVLLNGEELRYVVNAGTIILHQEKDKEGAEPKASIFFVAYTKEDSDHSQRPITFSFNGGPGSSSVWLHLGMVGPRRVQMADDIGNPTPPPYRLVDNEYTLLDQSDLVFIDPINTGYSRTVKGEEAKQFLGFKKDIELVGDFIQLYCSRYQRWGSPKYLIGESYGTTRAAGLAGYLQERHGMYLNGLMLISSILNFQTARFTHGNDLPYILFLPTYTATAFYHGKLPADLQTNLQETLAKAETFALGDYTLALMQGSKLPAEARANIVTQLAKLTGLSETYIEQTDLRINIMRFIKELLRDQSRTVGRLDSRFTSVDRDSAGETVEFDPSYATILGCYSGVLNDYLRRELQYANDLPYEILNISVNQQWSYKEHENEFVNVAETLRTAMTMNPHLRVFVGNGYYDLATPYLATHYTFNHLGLAASLQDNISMGHYEAGHMMYVHLPSIKLLKSDLDGFFEI